MKQLLLAASTTDSSGSSITEPAAAQLNALQKWWASIDWESIIGLLIQKALMLLFLCILFGILLKISNMIIDRIYRSYEKKASFNVSRINTIHTLIRNTVHYTLGFFLVYALLSTIGVPVGSLLAGAGVVGVALGLGAQGFMNDLITGFFIITEQQINVGDYVRLTNLTLEGTVTAVGIRTVQLKSVDGTVHYIPNRNITTISNTSRANMQVVVDVRILPSEGLDEIRAIIEEVNEQIAQQHEEEIQTAPTVFGLVDLGNNNFAIRTTMYVTNGTQWKIKEEFLAASIDALTAKGYTIPNAPIVGI
ncbi:MscS family small conductance mechanosenstive ion channel protein [Enterococcus sp. C1]|uniref:mechanosensitive ion channel family protein n=1 Tax=unclassified Enterococcus TaxID=2608891 RepID=UPI00027204E6|nr:mechanosensitive ion channel family protein [Enterococcus sp. C1]EJF48193.1 MscS family small conductance mechanosenstive ion channel protein [Enterococcus sp. C1]